MDALKDAMNTTPAMSEEEKALRQSIADDQAAMTANNGKFDNGWAGTYSLGKAKLGTSDQEITVSKDVTIVIAKGADSNNYTITGTDSNSGTKQYTYDSANGAISESAKAAAPAKP